MCIQYVYIDRYTCICNLPTYVYTYESYLYVYWLEVDGMKGVAPMACRTSLITVPWESISS